MAFASLPRSVRVVSHGNGRVKPIIMIAVAMLGIGIATVRVSAQVDGTFINDDAAVFRLHPELEGQLRSEIAILHRDTGVTALLKTLSFLADDSAANRARQIAEARSSDQPVAVLLFVRGNRSAGIGVNSALNSLVPAFELAALPIPTSDDKTEDARQLVEAYRHFFALVRRYAPSTGNQDGVDAASADSSTDKAWRAELWLLFAVLACAAMVVGITAWRCRRQAATAR